MSVGSLAAHLTGGEDRLDTDRWLALVSLLLTGAGLIMVLSSSQALAYLDYRFPLYYFVRQLAFAAIGLALMAFLRNLDYHVLRRYAPAAAAGYVMYGPATALVYTVGQGTHGFTLNPETGEFLLTHPDIRIPRRGKAYGINEGNVHSWHPGQRAFVEHLKTKDKASGRPYSLRYSGAMVADVHRTLLDGGLFMYPADWSDPAKPKAKLRLLYEVAPMGMIVEQAGGRASTGLERVLDLVATEYHQRAAVILGSVEDVATADEFYRR